MSARRLLAITDRRRMGADPLALAAARMELGRARITVLLREPDLSGRALHGWAEALVAVAARTGSQVLVSDRLDLALGFAGALGVQLPERGLSPADARALLGEDARVGASVHDAAGARRAIAAGAELLTLAPVLATPSKPGTLDGTQPVLGLPGLAALVAAARAAAGPRPVELYALGGVDADNVEAVLATGVDGVAAIRAAWDSPALLHHLVGG